MLDALFSPLRLGRVELRNRIVSTSHQTSLVELHLPTPDLDAYHRARSEGGAGLIVTEATAVHPSGLLTAHTIGGYLPEIVPAWRRLAEAVRPGGARLFAQLLHSGRELITAGYHPPTVAPSAVPTARLLSEPRALRLGEIAELVDGFRRCAAHAREAGLDGVEICAGFQYLPTQFLAPRLNHRRDRYGGSFENRVRFLTEVLAAMRRGIGDGAVGARLCLEELSPDANDPDDVLEAIRLLCRDGLVDYVSVAVGGSSSYVGSTWIVPPPPATPDTVERCARLVRTVATVPVVATSRVTDPAVADRFVREGVADAVGMTRALIADPELPRKARAGTPPNRCIGCNQGCIGHYHDGLPIACTVNPWTGYERVLPRPQQAARRATAAVVGAGPAGCAAAAALREAGHRVVVFERGAEPGGQMRLARANPGHADVADALIDDLGRWLGGCDVRLGTTADAGAVLAERPARVVLATGARPHRPPLEGSGVAVRDAFDVLAGAEVAGPVLVSDWGGGWTGLDTAEALAARGLPVRLATAAFAFAAGGVHQYQRNLYLARLYRAGVELVHHVEPVRLTPGAVHCRNVFSGETVVLGGVATLVTAAGREPEDELFDELAEAGVEAERVGDVLGPRGLEEAIREGTLAGLAEAVA